MLEALSVQDTEGGISLVLRTLARSIIEHLRENYGGNRGTDSELRQFTLEEKELWCRQTLSSEIAAMLDPRDISIELIDCKFEEPFRFKAQTTCDALYCVLGTIDGAYLPVEAFFRQEHGEWTALEGGRTFFVPHGERFGYGINRKGMLRLLLLEYDREGHARRLDELTA